MKTRRMTLTEQRKAASEFAKRWKGRGENERGECQPFWLDFLQSCLGIEDPYSYAIFEQRNDAGFPDVELRDAGVVIEQKRLGTDLDDPEPRGGEMKTPFKQALDYAQKQPPSIVERYIVTCNFESFRIYDRETDQSGKTFTSVALSELAEHIHLFNFITDPANSRIEREKAVSVKAGELIGKLHRTLMERYINPESEQSQHALNVLCVRLVFCFYAEDAGIFGEKDLFLNYLKPVPANRMHGALRDVFKVLDTPEAERDPYDTELNRFPYVNGGLFKGACEIPEFTEDLRHLLLFEVAQQTDWSGISPTVFGGVFESTLNPETRRKGGMHYTSVENIHKVIDPLFLDELNEEWRTIKADERPKKRRELMLRFQEKIASLSFLDPACGSGNFLTETYLCLRRLENEVLAELNRGQTVLGFEGVCDVKVSLGQLHGIEINDFAVRVAQTALWIAELQANVESEAVILRNIESLPLKDSGKIVEGNALTIDWNDVVPSHECAYIVGNPPFLGGKIMSANQRAEIRSLYGKVPLVNSIDYVSGWYYKAADYINNSARCAFVSTSSICQGQQVEPIWRTLIARFGIRIDFAWRSFVWNNEASDQAHVHVVIVGFSKTRSGSPAIFADGERIEAKNVSPYLLDAPNVIVGASPKPICPNAPRCDYGSLINDGGNYIFKSDELEEFLKAEPGAAKYVRPLVGADELIKGKRRFVLYLKGADAADLSSMPRVLERIRAVQSQRAASSAEATRKSAGRPLEFYFDSTTDENFLAIPSVSSERRRYVPMAICGPDVVATNLVSIIPGATVYHFGILSSQMHNAWMRVVAGRMKSDYRYSPKTVYNTFPWPEPTEEQRAEIERCAQTVLDAREQYPGCTLAKMYDPEMDCLFPVLKSSHAALDKAVQCAYGIDVPADDEPSMVAHLFELYAKLTEGEDNGRRLRACL